MDERDLKCAQMIAACDADATLSAAATEIAAVAAHRDGDDNGQEEVKRIMVEVKSAKPK